MSCSVKNCKECKRFRREDILFHRFPNDEAIRKRWAFAVGKKDDWKPTQNQFVCSKHFSESDYARGTKLQGSFLKHGAVPTLFLREQENNNNYKNVILNPQPTTSKPLVVILVPNQNIPKITETYLDQKVSISSSNIGSCVSNVTRKLQELSPKSISRTTWSLSSSTDSSPQHKKSALTVATHKKDDNSLCSTLSKQAGPCKEISSYTPSSSSSADNSPEHKKSATHKNGDNSPCSALRKRAGCKEISATPSWSSDSSERRRLALLIRRIHSYNKSPRKMDEEVDAVKRRQASYISKLHRANKKIASLNSLVASLQNMVNLLKKQEIIMTSENAIEHLQEEL